MSSLPEQARFRTEVLGENLRKLQIIALVGIGINIPIMIVDLIMARSGPIAMGLRLAWVIASVIYWFLARHGLARWEQQGKEPRWIEPCFVIAAGLSLLFSSLITAFQSMNNGPSYLYSITMMLICAFLVFPLRSLLQIMAPSALALVAGGLIMRRGVMADVNAIINLISISAFSLLISVFNYRSRVERHVQACLIARQASQLEAFGQVDGLTGLANRPRLDAFLAELEQNPDTGVLTLAFLDVDHMGEYNKSCGNLAGDQLLIRFARCIQNRLPPGLHLAGRYEGDRFLLLLSGMESSAAHELVQAIQQAITDLAIPHPALGNSPCRVSIGMASHRPDRDHPVATLLARADRNLFQARHRQEPGNLA